MKHTKRLLALLLTLALALLLALPSFAEGEPEEPNPAMPVITALTRDIRVRAGETYTLSVQAHIPNGDAIGYNWSGFYSGSWSENTFHSLRTQHGTLEYTVEVYNLDHPEYSVTETVNVEVYQTLGDRLGGVIADSWGWLIFLTYAGPIVFVIAPLYMLVTSPVVLVKLVIELFR